MDGWIFFFMVKVKILGVDGIYSEGKSRHATMV